MVLEYIHGQMVNVKTNLRETYANLAIDLIFLLLCYSNNFLVLGTVGSGKSSSNVSNENFDGERKAKSKSRSKTKKVKAIQ